MGKWSKCTLPEGFEKRVDELKNMTYSEINDLWISHGSLMLNDFANMNWYWSQMNGWACIDNCEGANAPAMLQVFCRYSDTTNDDKRVHFEKLCICLAVEFNAPREEATQDEEE